MKTKRMMNTPLYLSNQENHFYVQANPQGFVLQAADTATPLYSFDEPVLLLQGVAVNAKTVHLVFLKINGELCYSLISRTGIRQTTVLTKLDVRSTRYSRLVLLPLGEMVHIFYAYAHQTIADLWYIEHRLWNGKTWQSVHLGEVVHPRFPLYQVSTDTKGNIHFLSVTFQGHQSLLLYNRFHGAFSIWSSPTQVMAMPRDVIDMVAILTPDNHHHLFWVTKTPEGQFGINWAKRSQALDLTSTWHQAPAPVQVVNGPWQSLGAVEMNGSLWLLIKSEKQEHLMLYDGESWRLVATQPGQHPLLEFTHKTERSFYHTVWLEDGSVTHTPLFARQMGLNIPQIPSPAIRPRPVSALLTPTQVMLTPKTPAQPKPSADTPRPQAFVASLLTEDTPMPSPADVIESPTAGIIPPSSPSYSSGNPPGSSLLALSETPSNLPPPPAVGTLSPEIPSSVSASPTDSSPQVLETLVPLITAAMNPILQTVSTLAEEKKELSQALETVISHHTRTESALVEVEKQIKELQQQQLINQERGFWSRWFR